MLWDIQDCFFSFISLLKWFGIRVQGQLNSAPPEGVLYKTILVDHGIWSYYSDLTRPGPPNGGLGRELYISYFREIHVGEILIWPEPSYQQINRMFWDGIHILG